MRLQKLTYLMTLGHIHLHQLTYFGINFYGELFNLIIQFSKIDFHQKEHKCILSYLLILACSVYYKIYCIMSAYNV